ncbi:MAG TPA: hypothetical protein VIO33_23025 [Burkholderiaceae bacterium]
MALHERHDLDRILRWCDGMMRSHQRIILAMRTTLDIDSTALEAARQLAAHRAQSLGAVVSELILKGLRAEALPTARKSGFPVFANAASGTTITLDDVKRAEDDDA